jgi:ABC-type dipeptide/oligopeptide/nickel transport systems, permease components
VASYLLKRILQAVFVVIVVTLFVSYAVRLTGDPAVMMFAGGGGSMSEADLERIRAALGTDKPFYQQYFGFLKGLVTLDLGRSFVGGTPVSTLIAQAAPSTLKLAFVSLLISIVMSIPLGIWAAVSKGKVADQVIRIFSLIGVSFPNFWLATMLVLLFSIFLGLLPPSGMTGFESYIMPTLTMGVILTATNVRLVRTAMLETLQSQYVMVARAKGLSERRVLYKHALRNCAIPLITYFGLQFGGMLGGLVVIEKVFSWPGLGTLAFDAVNARDYPVLQSVITVLALLIVGVNLIVDIAYSLVDPRIRLE